jgi:hypothetical protein
MADEHATNGKDHAKYQASQANDQADGKDFDPMGQFRELRDGYLDAWAKATVDVVNSEAYAKASGQMLDTCLSASSPFREMTEKAMLQALQQLSMPSRADVISLAERLTNVEMKLDDIDAKLDLLVSQRQQPQRQPKNATRARKPAPAARSKRKG